jgi:uncharacterized protein
MNIRVGEVIAVNGIKITLKIEENSSKETLYFDGEKYKGVSIREYLLIQRGFKNIVCIVEGEYLDERRVETDGAKVDYIRKVDVRPIGYFNNNEFKHGIKFMPMIKDPAFLLQEDKIAAIYGQSSSNGFVIGRMLKEDIPIDLPWQKLFNTHIGIFGNTGSGKSNTLAKLYTTLFEKKSAGITEKSKFVVLDFNGEYTGEQLVENESKTVYKLSTQNALGDKFPLDSTEFWNTESLSLLFQATQNTQKPFLNRLIEGRARYAGNIDSLTNYARSMFRRAFCAAEPKAPTLDLMRSISRFRNLNQLTNILSAISWHSQNKTFYRPQATGNIYFNADGTAYDAEIAATINTISFVNLDAFEELIIRSYLQLIGDLIHGYVQFEHIQPLLKRVESSLTSLRKVLDVGAVQSEGKLLMVVSMKRCNSEAKKVLPLLIAKHFYNEHKNSVEHPPNKTLHLIVDEAHNILSQQSAREHESWKDYRLELFEEIIKEGRKFGVFITISSQRPADISPTIVSQLHNFFIHRLVNDRDLFLIDNTITTLDNLSKGLIPGLAQGCCVVTGTSFDLPMVLQIDPLIKTKQPDSEDVDLEVLWADPI